MFTRKDNRLKYFDYANNRAYFVTICTFRRQKLFGEIKGEKFEYFNQHIEHIFNNSYRKTEEQYKDIRFNICVTMPNHIHFIVTKFTVEKVSLSDIIKSFKLSFIKQYNDLVNQGLLPRYEYRIWQKSFNDRVIRDEKEYENIYNYILLNPQADNFKEYMKKLETEYRLKLYNKRKGISDKT